MSHPYELVQLDNGSFSIRSIADGEIFHPVEGPIREAEALYIRQLRLRERLPGNTLADEFVIWDVGLGAGGNALTAIRELTDLSAQLHIVSFDQTLEALRFAREQADSLKFPIGFERKIDQLLAERQLEFARGKLSIKWSIHVGDFPALLSSEIVLPAPHAIFFDAFSPARNPEMWTLPLFEKLFPRLEPTRPCAMATFSRSTMARVTMLLAGFYVGIGETIAGKEETTVAANTPELIKRPLDVTWLERARISKSAEPLFDAKYRQASLSPGACERLSRHPQFNSLAR